MSTIIFTLGQDYLRKNQIRQIIFDNQKVNLAPELWHKLEENYLRITQCAQSQTPIYGLNTGFGGLAEKKIAPHDQISLQKNIILSHAVGVGEPLDFHIAKTLILLRLNTLIQGYSGASPSLIKNLIALLNSNCAPFVPRQGSVGASGDLAPLAHLGLLLLGIGEALHNEKIIKAHKVLEIAGIRELDLGVRDGLAIINGTQAMAASAINALCVCDKLINLADLSAASTLDAIGGHITPFDLRIHNLKPHAGQIQTAKNILALTHGRQVHKFINNPLTQDPYSLRCVPQVHGASRDVFHDVLKTVEQEINSVTDNPLFFYNNQNKNFDVLSGGNFHGQYLALALDYLAMAVAELANISERRIELLLNPSHSNNLPAFLAPSSGINSGYMMLHVTASALVNENKVLCHPASVDSIPTSANREDHVSMGMTSANKLWHVINNTKLVLTIELMAAHQALSLRPKSCSGINIQKINQEIRYIIPVHMTDSYFKLDLEKLLAWVDLDTTVKLISQAISS